MMPSTVVDVKDDDGPGYAVVIASFQKKHKLKCDVTL